MDLFPEVDPLAADDEKWERAMSVVGAFRSGYTGISENHDRYLAEIYAECEPT